MTSPLIEYEIARAAIRDYCVATQVVSVRDLEEVLWPQLPDSIYVPLDVFRSAARGVLQELQENFEVLDNDEAGLLLARARSSSS